MRLYAGEKNEEDDEVTRVGRLVLGTLYIKEVY